MCNVCYLPRPNYIFQQIRSYFSTEKPVLSITSRISAIYIYNSRYCTFVYIPKPATQLLSSCSWKLPMYTWPPMQLRLDVCRNKSELIFQVLCYCTVMDCSQFNWMANVTTPSQNKNIKIEITPLLFSHYTLYVNAKIRVSGQKWKSFQSFYVVWCHFSFF